MIRLQRTGRKHEPTFRLVLTDSKNSTKSGKYLEVLGSHDPRNPDKTIINTERVTTLVSTGAQLSDTVHNLLISKKVIKGKKINVLPKKTPTKSDSASDSAKATSDKPAETTSEAKEEKKEEVKA